MNILKEEGNILITIYLKNLYINNIPPSHTKSILHPLGDGRSAINYPSSTSTTSQKLRLKQSYNFSHCSGVGSILRDDYQAPIFFQWELKSPTYLLLTWFKAFLFLWHPIQFYDKGHIRRQTNYQSVYLHHDYHTSHK